MPEKTQGNDLLSIAKSLDEAWNAHDSEKALRFFADDAVVRFVMDPVNTGEKKFPPDQVYEGKAQIRDFVAIHMPGFRVESKGHEVAGDKVTWHSTLSDDYFRNAGIEKLQVMAEALTQAGKIKSFIVTPSPESAAKIKSGIAPKA